MIGEHVSSQRSTRLGGVNPSFSLAFHRQELPGVVETVLADSQRSLESGGGIEAIAVTNRPGLKGSLSIGTNYAKYLSVKHGIPLIPIHHMEAHAITARLTSDELHFPFMVLLISGGHCLLAMAHVAIMFSLSKLS